MSDDKLLECPICGIKRYNLTKHVKAAHDMTADEIRELYPGTKMRILSEAHNKALQKGSRKYYIDNPGERSKTLKKWSEDNPEIHASLGHELGKKYGPTNGPKNLDNFRKNNPEKVREVASKNLSDWIKNNPEKHAANGTKNLMKWIEENTDKHKENGYNLGKKYGALIWTTREGRFNNVKHPSRHKYIYINSSGDTERYRSPEEVRFAKNLDENNIEYKYEELEIEYEYEGVSHYYYPDFYLPKYNLICEVHSEALIDDKMLAKREFSINNYNYEFKFITEKLLGAPLDELIKD